MSGGPQKTRVSSEQIVRVMQSGPVRARLEQVANQMAKQAETIANGEGVESQVWVESGTRPKGGPYSRVLMDNVAQEWGTTRVARYRVLGRASAGMGSSVQVDPDA